MRIRVTPVENRVVRDPQTTRLVPLKGAEVVATAYWRRLALDGDITVSDPKDYVPEPEPEPSTDDDEPGDDEPGDEEEEA